MEREMQLFVDSLRRNLTAEDIVNLEACVGCGNCGQACAWYLATGDERLHPMHRHGFIRKLYTRYLTLEGKLGGALGLVETPSVGDLRENMECFWKCTACGRCTLACPLGLSIRRVVRLARAAYCDSGLAEENPTLKAIVENTRRLRHSFGLTREQVFAMVGLFFYADGAEVPLDVKGAEYLFVCPAFCNTRVPDYGIKLPKILNAAGVSYTISTRVLDTGTDVDPIAAHPELSRQMLLEWEAEAERLGAEKVLVVECGCDVRTLYVEATETLGRPFKFPIVSVDSLMLELIKSGRLPVEKLEQKITLHDPCYVSRLAGMDEMLRELLHSVAENFVEMHPNREYNYCCNAGAGPLRLPENTELRRRVSKIKAEQIKNTGAELVTSPCAVCAVGIEDICRFYGLSQKRMSFMLFEVVYDAMLKALRERGEIERMLTPAELRGRDEAFLAEHSISGMFGQLRRNPEFPKLFTWLEGHEIVRRFFSDNPHAVPKLEQLRAEVGG
jgi:Fe-S oxidoreductase